MAIFQQGAFQITGNDTPESVARKRAIIAQIMGASRSPATIGEGISALGDGIVANVLGRRADRAESAGKAEGNSLYDGIVSAIRGDGFPEAPVIDNGPGLMGSDVSDMATRRVASAFGDEPATGNAPANWEAIRNGIFAGESGGDYDALFGFSNRPGKQFANTKLTNMSVDQALAFANPSGPYGQWVKGKVGRVATPMGAYQVVGSTLRAAKNGLGLTGNEQMSPALQDRIGQWILANQGTGAWEGYRGPRATSPAAAAIERVAPTQVASLDPTIGASQPGPDMGGLTQDNVNAYAARLAGQMGQDTTPPAGLPVGTPMATSEKGARVVRTLMDPQPMGGAPMPMQGMPAPAPAAPQQVAQARPDMSRVSPMAGGSAGVMQPGQPGQVPLDILIQAAGNPWLNENQRAVANLLLKQQMEAQDPMRAIDMDYRRAQIGKLNREAAGGNRRYGLNPIYGQDAQGNTVLGVLGDDGSFKPVDTGGVNISTGVDRVDLGTQWGLLDKRSGQMVGTLPKENYQEAFDTASGTNDAKSAAEARANLPKVEDNATAILGMIESLSTDPYLDSMVGPVSGRLPNVSADAARVQSKMDQIGGQAFLQAFETLRGGGQISNVEGERATAALARLNTAQSPQDYRQALEELSAIVRASLSRARRSAGSGSGNNPPSGASGDGWQDMGGVRIRRKQ